MNVISRPRRSFLCAAILIAATASGVFSARAEAPMVEIDNIHKSFGDLEVLKGLDAAHPGFGDRLFDENGKLRRFVNVYVDGHDASAPSTVHLTDRVVRS